MNGQPPDDGRLYVPLRQAACGVSLRLFRDRGGNRCAVGFTSEQRLVSVLGPREPFYRLTERAVRELAAERDVFALVVDPGMVAAPVRAVAQAQPVVQPQPQPQLSVRAARMRHPLGTWSPEATGILVLSAASGAAALLMQVL